MEFKAKLRKIGNSLGVIIPHNVITNYKKGDEIELNVITIEDKKQKVITSKPNKVITSVKKPQKVITSKPHKKLVFNAKTGMNEWA